MGKKQVVTPRPKPRRRVFIREWRKHRGLTLEQLAERVDTTHATLSRVERGRQDYTQGLLEALAEALSCDPEDLLMRDPTDPEGIWSVWDTVEPVQKKQAIRVLKTFQKTGS